MPKYMLAHYGVARFGTPVPTPTPTPIPTPGPGPGPDPATFVAQLLTWLYVSYPEAVRLWVSTNWPHGTGRHHH